MQDIKVKDLQFYVPADQKDRILNEYGEQTFGDFDKKGLNDALGALYPGAMLDSAYMSIDSWLRKRDGRVLYNKLGEKWSDMFNIIQSTITQEWY